jgi:hypothetical protein
VGEGQLISGKGGLGEAVVVPAGNAVMAELMQGFRANHVEVAHKASLGLEFLNLYLKLLPVVLRAALPFLGIGYGMEAAFVTPQQLQTPINLLVLVCVATEIGGIAAEYLHFVAEQAQMTAEIKDRTAVAA